MLKNISNLGSVLNKKAQQSITGGIQNEQEDTGCNREMTEEQKAQCCFINPTYILCLTL